jgi:TRAP-type mannitol/chloroaromatic compound transport system substrate-binding protein
MHSKFPIHKIADMAGKKGRFVGLAASVMGALGVVIAPLPTSEVYSALDKGVIDFADRGDLTANYEAGLAEVAKYVILPGVHQPSTAASYVANRAAYDKLPAEYKAVLAVAAREISGALRQRIISSDAAILAKYREKGCEILHLSDDDIAASRVKAMAAWKVATKNDALAGRVLDSQIAFMKELGLIH